MPIEVLESARWLEVRLSGRMTPVDGSSARDLVPPLASGRDVLFDYTDVTEFNAPVEAIVEIFRSLGRNAHRCAVIAPRPALFGVNRQAMQLADLDGDIRMRIFHDRPSAVTWLAEQAGAA